MLISVHVPKTAGTTFRRDLTDALGGRVLWDYGDAPEVDDPALREHERKRRDHLIADRERLTRDYDAIHGHFRADKYRDAFPDAKLIAFLRDPYRHALSSHAHAARAASPHPAHHIFLERELSVAELVETFPDHQTLYLGGIPLDGFAAIGIAERYEESIAVLERILGISFARGLPPLNGSPQPSDGYEISADLRAAVDTFRIRDLENYRLADERLTQMLRAYGLT